MRGALRQAHGLVSCSWHAHGSFNWKALSGSRANNRNQGQGGCREVVSTKEVRGQGTTLGARIGSEAGEERFFLFNQNDHYWVEILFPNRVLQRSHTCKRLRTVEAVEVESPLILYRVYKARLISSTGDLLAGEGMQKSPKMVW